MKKLSILAAGALVALSACNNRPANQFDLTGNIDGVDGQTIYLHYTIGDSTVIDSCVIANGAFTFTGNVDEPTNAHLYIGVPQYQSPTMSSFYIEPVEMTVEGLNAESFADAAFAGSKTQDEYVAYETAVRPIADQMMAVRAEMANPEADRDALRAKSDSLSAIYQSIMYGFIEGHPDSFVTPTLIAQLSSNMGYDELKAKYNALAPEVQQSASAKQIADELAALESIQPGSPAPDLIGVNPDGKEIKLSDLKGKVVLVDFWATWCGPCRASLPHVKELYNKYHDKGFEVFCVADDDRNVDGWKEVIMQEGMENYHNILRGLITVTDENGQFKSFDKSNDQSSKYAVHYIPTKYLVAADGTIVGKFDSNEELDAKIAELLN